MSCDGRDTLKKRLTHDLAVVHAWTRTTGLINKSSPTSLPDQENAFHTQDRSSVACIACTRALKKPTCNRIQIASR